MLQTNPHSVNSVMVPSKLPEMTYTADEQCQILFGPLASFCQEMQVRVLSRCNFFKVYIHLLFRSIDWRRGRWLYSLWLQRTPASERRIFLEKVSSFFPCLFESGRNWCLYWIKVRKEWSKNSYFKNDA